MWRDILGKMLPSGCSATSKFNFVRSALNRFSKIKDAAASMSKLLEGRAELLSSVCALRAKLLLNTHELVVLSSPLSTARSSGLDLSSCEANNEVSNGGVLSLTRSVRDHDAPALFLAHLAGLDGL
mmetsp:Transcript_16004/g.36548  ORF Transcript_16004/g.36548 Transcript_16004/m.36548 type:complete len:126 (+) Transcript_16004:877-1254(+)